MGVGGILIKIAYLDYIRMLLRARAVIWFKDWVTGSLQKYVNSRNSDKSKGV